MNDLNQIRPTCSCMYAHTHLNLGNLSRKLQQRRPRWRSIHLLDELQKNCGGAGENRDGGTEVRGSDVCIPLSWEITLPKPLWVASGCRAIFSPPSLVHPKSVDPCRLQVPERSSENEGALVPVGVGG